MRVSEEKIVEIRKSVNIVDIISDYIPIEQKGRNYFAICPFHDDHNPSMSISPEKQIYTCFVCGAHGNVFNFIMDYENVSFYEALKIVANKSNIELNIDDYNQNIEKRNDNNNLYEIYDFAFKYYQNNLLTKDGKEALDYLYKRDFTDEIIKEFGIGLSTKNKLTKVLLNKGYKNEDLLNSGISSFNDNIYDTFIDRIMFPLWDLDGKVVGFSGRIYKTNDSSKYVNSKESDIFKKGNLLYNYHRAKQFARRKKSVIIVEGFMDVIALYKVGIYNVVASMGTAITKEQARLLKKLSTNIILCFDGDTAGNKATLSCSNELTDIGIYPKIIRLPSPLDPDEFLSKYGKEKFDECLENPKSLLDYKIDYYRSITNFNNSEEISIYIKNVLSELNLVEDKIVKEIILKKLSDETNISFSTINGLLKENTKKKEKKQENKVTFNKYEKAERRLIFYMIRYPEVIRIYENNKCNFPTKEFRFLASEIIYYYNKHNCLSIADFLSYLNDKEELLEAFKKIDTLNINENYCYEEIMDYINLLNDYSIKERIKSLTKEFKKENDFIKKTEIAKEISELKVRV